MPVTAIQADGWKGTYPTPPTFYPDSSPEYINLTRSGYNASASLITDISEALVITRRVRNLYPNQATDTASDVCFSDYVYSTDSVSGATNSSTVASPVPIAHWVMPDRKLVGNTLNLEIIAFHRNARSGRMVAAVKFIATDGTLTVSQTVSATAVSTLPGDKVPVTVFPCALDISTLATGKITVNAEVYPWVGDASSVLNSTASSVAREFSPRHFLKNVTRFTSPPLAYVSTSPTDDTTGVWSTDPTTAAASPFRTVQGAINAASGASATGGILDGCRVRITAGTFPLVSAASARAQNLAGVTIERAPGVARASAIVQLSANYRARIGVGTLLSGITEGCLIFSDLTISRTGNFTFNGEAATQLRLHFENVDFNNTSQIGAWLSNTHQYIYGMTLLNMTNNSGLGAGTFENRIIRGVSNDFDYGQYEGWITIGCQMTRPGPSAFRDVTKGSVTYCNKFLNPTSAASTISVSGAVEGPTITGTVLVQNLIENLHTTTSSPSVRISSDSPAFGNTAHTIIACNTVTGVGSAGRRNIFYDTSTTARSHTLMMHKSDLLTQLNTKGDVFNADATRTGQIAYSHGVGCAGNFVMFRVNASTLYSEFQTYPGAKSVVGTSPTVRLNPLFTNYQGSDTTAGAGGGDYTLQSGSPAIGLLSESFLSHDLTGAPRLVSNDNAGAFTTANPMGAISATIIPIASGTATQLNPTGSVSSTIIPIASGAGSQSNPSGAISATIIPIASGVASQGNPSGSVSATIRPIASATGGQGNPTGAISATIIPIASGTAYSGSIGAVLAPPSSRIVNVVNVSRFAQSA